jgi:UDP-glucose 4-epimerase
VKLLVTGGAGYVGSVCAAHLVDAGHDVTVLDDLSTGHADAVPDGAEFVKGDVGEAADDLLADGVDGVLHFAARSLVGESVQRPELYWQGNVVASLRLLEAIRRHGTPRLVFSSTAATYGEPEQVPIREDAPARPTNPYGASKLAIDNMITSYAVAHGLAGVSLRYFNVAGAHGRFGERHVVETHLIPIVLQVASGDRESMQIYGDDWPTPDGTCVRDYIHVDDLAEAHLLALAHAEPGRHAVYNLGSGTGFSVREVVEACRAVTGHPIPRWSPPAAAATPPCWWPPARRRPPRWAGGPPAPTWPRSSATPGASPSSATAPDRRQPQPGPLRREDRRPWAYAVSALDRSTVAFDRRAPRPQQAAAGCGGGRTRWSRRPSAAQGRRVGRWPEAWRASRPVASARVAVAQGRSCPERGRRRARPLLDPGDSAAGEAPPHKQARRPAAGRGTRCPRRWAALAHRRAAAAPG